MPEMLSPAPAPLLKPRWGSCNRLARFEREETEGGAEQSGAGIEHVESVIESVNSPYQPR
jgi:hypothetical protein